MRRVSQVWGLWVPVLVTAVFFVLLSAVHSFSGADSRGVLAAFQPHDGTSLSDATLVDSLSSLPLSLSIGQADWESGTLIVDLKITEEQASVETVYHDLATILSFSFNDKDNVSQIYLRFVAVDAWSGARYLVLASNVTRAEWDPELLQELKHLQSAPFSERLVQGLHLTLTNLWMKQFSAD